MELLESEMRDAVIVALVLGAFIIGLICGLIGGRE